MHEKVMPKGSKAILDRLEGLYGSILKGWILAGGTGLALRIGHRVSEDFDFFRNDPFELRSLHDAIGEIGSYETLQEYEYTLTVIAAGIKLSFFQIPDPFIFDCEPYRFFSVADIRDIALMKLVAISGRGSRKDFIDLYSILRSGPTLQEYLDMLPKKYSANRINVYHIVKSLTYFDDAEAEPMPRMLEPFDWEECKRFFIRQAHSIVVPQI